MASNGTAASTLARDNTMVTTAKEGIAFLKQEGADDLVKLQGLEGDSTAKNDPANGVQNKSAEEKCESATKLCHDRTVVESAKEAEKIPSGESLGESHSATEMQKPTDDSPSKPKDSEESSLPKESVPAMPQHRTILETTKDAEKMLAGETIAETRKATEQLKETVEKANSDTAETLGDKASVPSMPLNRTMVETAEEAKDILAGETIAESRAASEKLKETVASTSPIQKCRTMVETAKIGQALLGAEAAVTGETRKQTEEIKHAEIESAAMDVEKAETKAEGDKNEKKQSPSSKKSPLPKTPQKVSPRAKRARKDDADVPVEVSPVKPSKPADQLKTSSSPAAKKRGRSSVDTLLLEAQKFAGDSAGDVNSGRSTRRSRGVEVTTPPKESPAKRGRQSAKK